MIKNILAATIVFFSITLVQSCDNHSAKESHSDSVYSPSADANNHSAHSAEHDGMMKKIMDDMNAVKMTGDVDLDFAAMMIPHHQGAVDMSEDYLLKAKDEKIKSMAQNIINAQKKEIEELQAMIADHKPAVKKDEHSGNDSESHKEMMAAMKKMEDDMKNLKMTGDADVDFVKMMIPHHQSAIDMAKTEISQGKNIKMMKFAKKVIADQKREISDFEEWLKNN